MDTKFRTLNLVVAAVLLLLAGLARAGEAPGYSFPPSGGGGSGTISSGTTDYLPKYTGATTLGDSTLSDDGGGEFTWHWGGGNIVRWSAANLAKPEYYYYPAMGNYSLFNTIGVLAPSVSWNGGNRLAGVAVSAPTFSSGSVTTNVATINTTAAHGLTTGDIVTVSGSTGVTVDGTFKITVVDSDTFTYAITVGNGTITAATITPVGQLQLGGAVSSPPTSPLSIGGATTITGSADVVQLTVKANGTQTAHIQEWKNTTGSTVAYVQEDQGGGFFGNVNLFNGTTSDSYGHYSLGNPGLKLGNDQSINWSNDASATGTLDTGLARSAAGQVKVTDGSTGGGSLVFPQLAAKPTLGSNQGAIYSKDVAGTAEVFVEDEAGNETQISPHAKDCPAKFADDQPQDIVYHHTNAYLGTDEWIRLSAMARALEKLEGKPGAYLIANPTPIKKADWAADQQKLQDQYDAARAKEAKAAADFNALPAKARTGKSAPVVRPAKDIRKPCPEWMKAAQGAK